MHLWLNTHVWMLIVRYIHKIMLGNISYAINVTIPQFITLNQLRPIDAYMRRKLTITGLDNGLSPGRRKAIIWTSAGILLIGQLGTNISQILIGIQTLLFKNMHLKMSSPKWSAFSLGLGVLISKVRTSVTSPRTFPIFWYKKGIECVLFRNPVRFVGFPA